MYEPKREYNLVKEKKEERTITCVNCGRVVAVGSSDLVMRGKLTVHCPKCGTRTTIEVSNDKGRQDQAK